MSSTSAQRKAWNDAMRSAGGTAALPPALQPNKRKRRSDRTNTTSKQSRRDKARKNINHNDPESKEFMIAAWMDALEDVPINGIDGGDGIAGADDDDDEYDELEELEGKGSGNKRKKRKASTKSTTAGAGTMPKRFKPRSLASILLEEVNREDGVAYAWLENEARLLPPSHNNKKKGNDKSSSLSVPLSILPPRKYCPVTGMEGIYIEPKTFIPYANLQALEQIRERPPPWMILGGTIAYHEAVKSIRGDEEEQQNEESTSST